MSPDARSTPDAPGPVGVGAAETDPAALAVEAIRALARASRALERASSELTLPHYRVLAAVASGDERASRIADRLALGKPTISASVDALCQRVLARSEVEGDQRAAALHLTPDGQATLARVEAAMTDRVLDLCHRTPDGSQVLRSLGWLGAAIDEATAERHAAERGERQLRGDR